MKNFLITVGGIVFIALCCGLSKLWTGLLYFGLTGLTALAIYWAVLLIFSYRRTFVEEFDEQFRVYLANLVNYSSLTSEEVAGNIEFHKKKFKKTLIVDKTKRIAIISVLFVVAIICVSLMISGKIS